jgi:hypothetical protein
LLDAALAEYFLFLSAGLFCYAFVAAVTAVFACFLLSDFYSPIFIGRFALP